MSNQNNENFNTLQAEQDAAATPSRPVVSEQKVDGYALKNVCPQHAIGVNPDRIDLGKCNFCHECEAAFPEKISFTTDHALATNVRDRLIVIEGDDHSIGIDHTIVRAAIKSIDGKAISFYAVSDAPFINPRISETLGRSGISLSTKAFECSGLLLTGSISNLSNEELTNIYSQLREPKIVVVAGMQAINTVSGNAALAGFFTNHTIDLFVPGAPATPDAIGHGIIELIRSKNKNLSH